MSRLTLGVAAFKRLWASDGIAGRLARGGFHSFAAGAASAAAAFAVQILLARVLGVEGFGSYSYALVWLNFVALFGAMGCETVAVRYVASYTGTGALGKLHAFMRWVLRVPPGFSLGLGGLAALILVIPGLVSAPVRPVMLVAAALLPLLVFLKMTAAILQGAKRVAAGIAIQGVLRPVLIGAFVAAIALAGQGVLSPQRVMWVNFGVTLVVAILSYRMVVGVLPGAMWSAPVESEASLWRRAAWSHFLISAFQTLLVYTDVLLLGLLRSTREAGIYTVVAQISGMIAFGVTAINTIAAPLIAERHALGKRDEVRRVLYLATLGMTIYGVLVAGAIIAFRTPILALYGPDFVPGATALVVLVAGQLVIAFNGPVGFVMTMTGHERTASAYVGATAGLNLVLNLLLIPRFGLIGAAAATATAVALRSLALRRWVRHNLET